MASVLGGVVVFTNPARFDGWGPRSERVAGIYSAVKARAEPCVTLHDSASFVVAESVEQVVAVIAAAMAGVHGNPSTVPE